MWRPLSEVPIANAPLLLQPHLRLPTDDFYGSSLLHDISTRADTNTLGALRLTPRYEQTSLSCTEAGATIRPETTTALVRPPLNAVSRRAAPAEAIADRRRLPEPGRSHSTHTRPARSQRGPGAGVEPILDAGPTRPRSAAPPAGGDRRARAPRACDAKPAGEQDGVTNSAERRRKAAVASGDRSPRSSVPPELCSAYERPSHMADDPGVVCDLRDDLVGHLPDLSAGCLVLCAVSSSH